MTNVSSTDLDALRHHAAYAQLTDRAFLRITGPDATRWLNGMVTNNIKDLAPGEGNYNFLLNAQGRIQADATIYREPGEGDPTYLLETGDWQLETVQQHLDKFIIMDDVELTPISMNGVSIIGPNACRIATAEIATPAPEMQLLSGKDSATGAIRVIEIGSTAITILRLPHPAGPKIVDHIELLSNNYDWLRMQQHNLQQIGYSEATPAALEAHRILSGIPKYGTDITEKDLPQETGQTHALHFSKGCYLGQEIVERIHSRGQVHRIFSKFTLTGVAPTLPAPLTVDGKSAGELTSAVEIDGQLHALGYLRREFAAKPLSYEGGVATATASH
jgi:folate-binding protein YgfZ